MWLRTRTTDRVIAQDSAMAKASGQFLPTLERTSVSKFGTEIREQ